MLTWGQLIWQAQISIWEMHNQNQFPSLLRIQIGDVTYLHLSKTQYINFSDTFKNRIDLSSGAKMALEDI